MKYTKPEITMAGPALEAIQSMHLKPNGSLFDAPLQNYSATSDAYEADE